MRLEDKIPEVWDKGENEEAEGGRHYPPEILQVKFGKNTRHNSPEILHLNLAKIQDIIHQKYNIQIWHKYNIQADRIRFFHAKHIKFNPKI